jgi:TetR/AcrR family transcriptional repressor of mexJK operon
VATRRGRPTQEEARQLDLAVREAAVATFVEMGYAGAGMEAIARAAGITNARSMRGTPTSAVFADVIPWALARYTDDPLAADIGDEDVETALVTLGRASLERATHPQDVRLKRIAFNEAARAIVADYRAAEAGGVSAVGRNGKLVNAALMRQAANVVRRAVPAEEP